MNSAPAQVVRFVRKITTKSISELRGINLLQLPRPIERRVLYDLFGTVFSATVKPDRSGTKADSIQFKGEFQAVNAETGEVYADSGVAYIPVMDAVLYSALKNAQEKDDKARIAIAFRVSIGPAPADKPSATGYEFDVQRLIPQDHREDSPIERLKRQAKEYAARSLPSSASQPVVDSAADSSPASDPPPPQARAGRNK